MNTRANYQKLAPASFHALLAFSKSIEGSPLGPGLIDLVHIRASQMNGCLFCLDMHSKEARKRGERELRLYHLAAWRESPLFSAREKAALAWTERLTAPTAHGSHGIEDEDYAQVATEFNEKEISDLTLVIAGINAWNRLGIAFRPTPGALDKVMGLDQLGLQ
jgi:AhpD family alkylhydroperoxidase